MQANFVIYSFNYKVDISLSGCTHIERFGRVYRSIEKKIVSNSLKSIFIEWVNCNNFQIGVYLSKATSRFAQIAQFGSYIK
jgi:hypothetical protein